MALHARSLSDATDRWTVGNVTITRVADLQFFCFAGFLTTGSERKARGVCADRTLGDFRVWRPP